MGARGCVSPSAPSFQDASWRVGKRRREEGREKERGRKREGERKEERRREEGREKERGGVKEGEREGGRERERENDKMMVWGNPCPAQQLEISLANDHRIL
jgi:hypothetical protein